MNNAAISVSDLAKKTGADANAIAKQVQAAINTSIDNMRSNPNVAVVSASCTTDASGKTVCTNTNSTNIVVVTQVPVVKVETVTNPVTNPVTKLAVVVSTVSSAPAVLLSSSLLTISLALLTRKFA